MKNLFIAFALVLCSFVVSAQTVKPSTDKVLKDTTINKVDYKLYEGTRGGKYVLRTAKSGNVYKQYIKK